MGAETRRRGRLALSWALRIVVPPLPPEGRPRLFGVALSALGALSSFGFLFTTIHPAFLLVAAAVVSGLVMLTATGNDQRAWRVIRVLSWTALITLNAGWLYLALAFGTMLGWAVPTYQHVLAALLVGLSVYSTRPGHSGPGWPLSVALGFVILASVTAWRGQDGIVRCDDYARAVGQLGVDVAVPTSRDLPSCREGTAVYVRRYPRALWESPDGGRFVFTTTSALNQDSAAYADGARVVETELDHTICETRTDSRTRPTCLGDGTAQTILESESLDRLFIPAWGRLSDGIRGMLYELPRTGELRVERQLSFPDATTEGFYDPGSDSIFLITDAGHRLLQVRASTLTLTTALDGRLQGGDTRYDPVAGEGMHCHGGGPTTTIDGEAFIGVAVTGSPFSFRALGGSTTNPTAWVSMSWGCDFDPRTRRAWSTVPALGQLVELDYDTGEIRRRLWVGMGGRAVTFDRERGRLYVAGFHTGQVITVDIDAFEEVGRHFVGRFARRLVISRDGDSLFATSNLGIVRIALP
jgi:hypothetical protein